MYLQLKQWVTNDLIQNEKIIISNLWQWRECILLLIGKKKDGKNLQNESFCNRVKIYLL